MPQLTMSYKKTLKLTNVIVTELVYDAGSKTELIIEQMENFIKSKGVQPIGPHIQYTDQNKGSNSDIDITFMLMRQATGYINHIEKPYEIKSIIKIPNCLYIRYCGSSEKMKFAYDKLILTAYEEDIPLKGNSYTIFLDEANDVITVDIFMERAD